MIKAPWTHDQVLSLNRWQGSPYVHPFTCGQCRDSEEAFRDAAGFLMYDYPLVATLNGWICPTCDYTQNWAHAEMLKDVPNPFQFGGEVE